MSLYSEDGANNTGWGCVLFASWKSDGINLRRPRGDVLSSIKGDSHLIPYSPEPFASWSLISLPQRALQAGQLTRDISGSLAGDSVLNLCYPQSLSVHVSWSHWICDFIVRHMKNFYKWEASNQTLKDFTFIISGLLNGTSYLIWCCSPWGGRDDHRYKCKIEKK